MRRCSFRRRWWQFHDGKVDPAAIHEEQRSIGKGHVEYAIGSTIGGIKDVDEMLQIVGSAKLFSVDCVGTAGIDRQLFWQILAEIVQGGRHGGHAETYGGVGQRHVMGHGGTHQWRQHIRRRVAAMCDNDLLVRWQKVRTGEGAQQYGRRQQQLTTGMEWISLIVTRNICTWCNVLGVVVHCDSVVPIGWFL